MLELKIDDTALKELGKRLGATDAQIIEARNRTIAALQRQVDAAARREAARTVGAPQRVIRGRIRKGDRSHHGPDELHVWLGARAIDAVILGRARPYGVPGRSGGVKVGRHDFRGAFRADVYRRGKPSVWMRVASKQYSPDLYWKHSKGVLGKKGRFPLAKPFVRIEDEIRLVAERQRAGLGPAFCEEFARQVRALVFKGGAR